MLRIAIKPPNERSMRPSTGTHKVHREAGGAGSLPGKWESERGRSLAIQLDPIKAPQLLTRSLSSLSAEESPAWAAKSGQFASRVSRPCPGLIVPRETFGEHVPAKFHTTKSRHPPKSPANFFFLKKKILINKSTACWYPQWGRRHLFSASAFPDLLPGPSTSNVSFHFSSLCSLPSEIRVAQFLCATMLSAGLCWNWTAKADEKAAQPQRKQTQNEVR